MENIDISDLEAIQPNDEPQNDGMYEHHRITIDKGQSQTRIDKFLLDRISQVSRNKIQNAIRAGSVRVDGQEVKPNYKIRPLQTIVVVLPTAPSDGYIEPQEIPLNVVYEDDDVMVINKQPGLVVHPGLGNHDHTLVNALAWYFKEKQLPIKAGNQPDRPGLVHRIDKDTSGLMVIAKNDYAMTHLAKQFFDHSIDRTYWALVWGQPEEMAGTIDMPVGRNPRDRMLMHVFTDGNDEGKQAITHYKVIEPMYYVSLVECKLETGRTHQIRIHMKHLGHTLFQDERYGGDEILKGTIFTKYKQFVLNCFKVMTRQALHAKTLGFTHPTTGERMFFESELPEDFSQVLQKWREYLNTRKSLL
jgi:23S rRNA pseudouridine1911/1915/1917 synthase